MTLHLFVVGRSTLKDAEQPIYSALMLHKVPQCSGEPKLPPGLPSFPDKVFTW